MRNDEWLEEQLNDLWDNHFADIPQQNIVTIKFGKKSKRQLGSIKLFKNPPTKIIARLASKHSYQDLTEISLITITSYFKELIIPELVIRGTIAHEICHYAHGFNSPLPRKYSHPHKGGIIRKELKQRDLLNEYKEANKWLKANWSKFVQQF